MNHLGKFAALATIVGMTGCATILNEDFQKVNVVSSDGRAIEGTIDGTPFQGPGIVDVKRANEDKIVMVDTAGCVQETVATKSVDSVFFVNILSGGAFGSTTDFASEKMWKYDDTIEIICE